MNGLFYPPSHPNGPCRECFHTDCMQTKQDANLKCPVCKEIIGYDREWYLLDFREQLKYNAKLAHADCWANRVP